MTGVKRLLWLGMVLMGTALPSFSQKTTRIIIVDSASFQPLPAVFIQVKNTNRSMVVDPSGIITINTKKTDTLMLSHVGYKSLIIPLFFEEDAILIRMKEQVTLLNEVTVKSRKLYPNEINPRRSSLPKTRTFMESVLQPWEYFNKREKEKRKVKLLMVENDRIRTFIEVVTDPAIKEDLMLQHDLSDQQYYDILVKFNQRKFPVMYSSDADEIITALQDFFAANVK
jgi:hypothetical protein